MVTAEGREGLTVEMSGQPFEKTLQQDNSHSNTTTKEDLNDENPRWYIFRLYSKPRFREFTQNP